MRTAFLLITAVVLGACARTESPVVTVEKGKVARINGCHVLLDEAYEAYGARRAPRALMHFACGVPESALGEKEWWGQSHQPPGFTIDVGDCMPLDNTYYCLESVVDAASATFRATYKKPTHPLGNLERMQ
ncbi:hypothetical protein [Polyangium mundeleinium]|uniref:Lipoprotein n=1 Tax=Polyangium mundeleinium TaxID=2995306 RepID=A0ABT5F551_9BACT|nr:hypothetical protein [Polyangium mundeleinium]MDC0748226.1 hypothetical protein [Polyangium mundeleinium]